MKKVAKLLMVDPADNYLLLYRSDHPFFGTDPDLPGGMVEDGETMLEAMLREVYEEAGVVLEGEIAEEVYSGTKYSTYGTHDVLFVANVSERPTITISWEHSSYEWLDRSEFLSRAKSANDSYMHMVHDVLNG
jgi:8-oxo-dGTP diphosphatase